MNKRSKGVSDSDSETLNDLLVAIMAAATFYPLIFEALPGVHLMPNCESEILF